MLAVTAATPWFSRTIVSTLVTPVGVVEALAVVEPFGVVETLGVVDEGAERGRPVSPAGLHAASSTTATATESERRQGVRRRTRSIATADRRTRKKRSTLERRGERRERNDEDVDFRRQGRDRHRWGIRPR